MSFERFTDRARRAVVLAQEHARMMRHGTIGTEHLLLGLVAEGDGVAFRALSSLGVTLDAVRAATEKQRQPGRHEAPGHLPFNDSAKWACEQALREAVALSVPYVGTEHVLLALARAQNHTGAFVLADLGVSLLDVRAKVLELLHGYAEAEKPPAPKALSPCTRCDGSGTEPESPPEPDQCVHCCKHIERTAALAAMLADLEGYVWRRAAELARPLIEEAEGDAAKRVLTALHEMQRQADLVAELRKTLDVRDKQLGAVKGARLCDDCRLNLAAILLPRLVAETGSA